MFRDRSSWEKTKFWTQGGQIRTDKHSKSDQATVLTRHEVKSNFLAGVFLARRISSFGFLSADK